MEKEIKYYVAEGYVDGCEANDYVVHAMSKALAVQLKDKITHKEALLLALSLSEDEHDFDKCLMGDADVYEIIMYYTMKKKIETLSDAWDDMSENIVNELKMFKADKEQMLIAIAYAACCGFINNWDNE